MKSDPSYEIILLPKLEIRLCTDENGKQAYISINGGDTHSFRKWAYLMLEMLWKPNEVFGNNSNANDNLYFTK